MESVGRPLRYLNRLCDRMDHCGFTPVDPLYQAAFKAKDAAQQLFMAAHYARCASGVACYRSPPELAEDVGVGEVCRLPSTTAGCSGPSPLPRRSLKPY